MNIEEIARKFKINGDLIEKYQIMSGHINITYKLTFKNDDVIESYILQRMNKNVFKNPVELMDNIKNVTSFIKDKLDNSGIDSERMVLHFLKTDEDKYYFIDDDNEYWRAYVFVKNSICFNDSLTDETLYEGAKAFGNFMNELSDFDAVKLHITIKDFHNTIERYNQLKESIKVNKDNRIANIKEIVSEYLNYEDLASKMTKMLNNNELPLRVTHNDTKCNNVLYDADTKNSLAVIDLDTIMPGLLGFDFGDALRTAGSNAKEDEKDLSKVTFNLDKFKIFAKGYIETVKESITKNELDTLALGCITMTLECGSRFLADYLNGDIYFHINYQEHNLDRAINQLTLAKDMIKKYENMNDIVHSIYNS